VRPVFSAALRLWERARSEHCTPGEVGWAVGIGVFAGCTPFLGLHMWIAIAIATLFGKNRLWAFVGSRVSFMPVFTAIAFCEIEAGHRLRVGAWLVLSPHDAVARGQGLIGDWLLGSILFGGLLAIALGLAAYFVARRSAAARRS
jgi:uncharacterized protein (DUF2062 family)